MNNTPLDEIRKALDAAKHFDFSTIDNVQSEVYKVCSNAPTWLHSLLEENERITKERDELGEIVKAAVIPCHVCMKNGCDCNVTYFSDFATGEMAAKQYNEIQQLREELEQRTNERNEAAAHAIGWKSICGEVRTELAAKDKVLEEARDTIRNMKEDYPGEMWTWLERRNWLEEADNQIKEIGSILSQYARSAIVPNE